MIFYPRQSYKSVFEKKLCGESNTDYKDITDFIKLWYSLTERSIRVNPINPRSKKKLSGETNTDYKDWTDEKISINKGGFYKFPPSKWLIIVCWRFAIFWILFGSNCKLTQSRSSLRSLFNLQFNLENNSKIWQS